MFVPAIGRQRKTGSNRFVGIDSELFYAVNAACVSQIRTRTSENIYSILHINYVKCLSI